jgi:hypothetical protein
LPRKYNFARQYHSSAYHPAGAAFRRFSQGQKSALANRVIV